MMEDSVFEIVLILGIILFIVDVFIYFKVFKNISKMKEENSKRKFKIIAIFLIILSFICIELPKTMYCFGVAIDATEMDKIIWNIEPFIPLVIQLIFNLILLKMTIKQLKKEGETKCQE